MSPKKSIVLCLALATASKGESDCQRDAGDYSSLLQTANLGVKRNRKVLDGAELLQTAHAITKKVNSGQDPADCARASGAAREAVEASLPAIREQHAHHVNQIQIAADAVEACASRELDGLAMLTQRGSSVETSRSEHSDCRQGEQDLEGGLEACEQFEQLRNSFGSQQCFSLPEVGGEEWIAAMQHIMDTAQNALAQGQPLQESCANAQESLAAQQTECASAQRQFEEDYCAYRESCAHLQICRVVAEENYEEVVAEVESSMVSLRSEFQVMKHVECLLGMTDDALAQNTIIGDDVLGSCSEPASTDELAIDFPHFAPLDTCEATILTRSPCGENFLQAEYSSLAQHEAIEAACVQCAALPLAGAPVSWLRHLGVDVDLDNLQPAEGSPAGCACTLVDLQGEYSAGPVVRCDNCLDTYRSTDPNSCPSGFKIFSPRIAQDWETIHASLDTNEFRSPNFIVDVTRPENGCGGCGAPMNSDETTQSSWVTSDGSPWFLRSTGFGEPNGDYTANCFLMLHQHQAGEMAFNDGSCMYHSNNYLCQLDEQRLMIAASSSRQYDSATTPGPWALIIQYGTEGTYTPTSDAVGVPSENEEGFAKLSDADINALSAGGAYHYYWLTSDGPNPSVLIRLPSTTPYDDMPISPLSGGEFCLSAPAFTHVNQCTSWGAQSNVLDNIAVSGNNCNRWFLGHSRHCYMPASATQRCYSHGSSCALYGQPHHSPRRNVKVYKFTAE